MHESAKFYAKKFFEIYCNNDGRDKNFTIVEIGSRDINGSLREIAPDGVKYIGLDFEAGNGVDIILKNPYKLPLGNSTADLIVCSSCFEHSDFFWLLFLEILRVLKKNGVFYLNAPSNGYFHQWPVDCWRFYPDAGHALVSWAKYNGYKAALLESFIGRHSLEEIGNGGGWNDFVGIFIKDSKNINKFPNRILDTINHYSNAYTSNITNLIRREELSADHEIIINLKKQLVDKDSLFNSEIIKIKENITELSILKDESDKLLQERNQIISSYINELSAQNNKITEVYGALLEFKSHYSKSNILVADRDRVISSRDKEISRLNNYAEDLRKTIADLQLNNDKRDQVIYTSNNSILSLTTELDDLRRSMHYCELELSRLKDSNISYLAHVAELESSHFDKEREIVRLNSLVNSLTTSNSWILTRPLREGRRLIKDFYHNLKKLVKILYKLLPLNSAQRFQIKTFIFKRSGFLFKDSVRYIEWREFERIRSHKVVSDHIASKSLKDCPEMKFVSAEIESNLLRQADGVWEWLDYDKVKSSIQNIKKQISDEIIVDEPELVRIKNTNQKDVAKSIKFLPVLDEPQVSIIIPVYNNLELTLECLMSVLKNTSSSIKYEVIVADDASTDQTEYIIGLIQNLKYIRNKDNIGFLRNVNNAARIARGEYLVLLNNDVQVVGGWLDELISVFNSRELVGIVGPKYIYPSGYLQEAGGLIRYSGQTEMVGLNDDPDRPRYNYIRKVDYVSGACLIIPSKIFSDLNGFSEDYLPCYFEDSDLCLRVRATGYFVYYAPKSIVIHHLSKTTASGFLNLKKDSIANNQLILRKNWGNLLDEISEPKLIAFYLPQFHPIPENNKWWGEGFTEWTNVNKAKANYIGHYQPRRPADLGYYDLRVQDVMKNQAELAKKYGIYGFCYYYYWFAGKRLLDIPLENMLQNQNINIPFCLCWANENWTRRWDGLDQEILIAQDHSVRDDEKVIRDLMRYFIDKRYIRIDGKPLILVYRPALFPNFRETVFLWRRICRQEGIGELFVSVVESMELVNKSNVTSFYGCDAAVEFAPQGFANQGPPPGKITNPEFNGYIADYIETAIRYATRDFPDYTRFKCVMPGWDNTARRQNNSFCFDHSTPGAFQAWLEEAIEDTRMQYSGDERIVFINAWNEWAEGAYLEPDVRFGHTYLEAIKNAKEYSRLIFKRY